MVSYFIFLVSHPHFLFIRCIKGEPAIEEYSEMASQADIHRDAISEAVMQSSAAQQFLSPGRVVVIRSHSVSIQAISCLLAQLQHGLFCKFSILLLFIYFVFILAYH